MKKLLILTVAAIISILNIHAQTPSEIIFIGTSYPIPSDNRGIVDKFGRFNPIRKANHTTDPIMFTFGSTTKHFQMNFFQFNYNDRPNREPLQTVDYDIRQLECMDVIDIDDFIATKSYEEFYQFMRDNIHSRIWIIDRNDFYKSSPELDAPDKMKAIQMKIFLEMIPERFMHPSPEDENIIIVSAK